MRPAVALGVAAACFAAASICYRHRDGILRLATRIRGLDRYPPGSRRRYQRGPQGRMDMLLPVLFFVVFGMIFLARALLALPVP
jgi:hypothetical protein